MQNNTKIATIHFDFSNLFEEDIDYKAYAVAYNDEKEIINEEMLPNTVEDEDEIILFFTKFTDKVARHCDETTRILFVADPTSKEMENISKIARQVKRYTDKRLVETTKVVKLYRHFIKLVQEFRELQEEREDLCIFDTILIQAYEQDELEATLEFLHSAKTYGNSISQEIMERINYIKEVYDY